MLSFEQPMSELILRNLSSQLLNYLATLKFCDSQDFLTTFERSLICVKFKLHDFPGYVISFIMNL